MTQKELFDEVSIKTSRLATKSYSTSFSIGIRCLDKELRNPIYAIYGFVRFADEIVDTFHQHDKQTLLARFKDDTFKAIEEGISLNPILNSFQDTVRRYNVDHQLIHTFLKSMEMDLTRKDFDQQQFEEYILGSAEVVGLMCLHVFCNGDQSKFEALKPYAMKLGAAFQKINFLRDLNADYTSLGRSYFPGIDLTKFDDHSRRQIEDSIRKDFEMGYEGIRRLTPGSRFGVYVAYLYYLALFKKIKNMPTEHIMKQRISIRKRQKLSILCYSFLKHQLNMI